MITVLHFNLINPIMMGNKKTKDVQFYAEVMDVVQVRVVCGAGVCCEMHACVQVCVVRCMLVCRCVLGVVWMRVVRNMLGVVQVHVG